MPIVTPRRRYVRHNSFGRNRYSNFKDWLDQEALRLAASARSVRDSLTKLGIYSTDDVEAAADATPGDIDVISTGAVAGAAGKNITSGTVTDAAATYVSDGIVNGDTVELIYSGADYPNELRFIGLVSSIAETSFDVTPAPTDAAWAASADVTISVINPLGRD